MKFFVRPLFCYNTVSMELERSDQYLPESAFQKDNPNGIDVAAFVARYDIEHPQVREVLEKYPPLCYLLGRVQPAFEDSGARVIDPRPDDFLRPVSYLVEGSGMFGLTDRYDALRWRGIFNHILGTSRQVYYLADRLSKLTSEQIQRFADLGFDISTFREINPVLLRDFMLVSHAGRRQMDEYNWHDLRDSIHFSGDSGYNTVMLLKSEKADSRFLELMRVEIHAEYLVKGTGKESRLPNLTDNALTYPDWTFGQKPNTLRERFAALEGRAPPEVLAVLELGAITFENALQEIVSPNIFDEMTHAGLFAWETEIRQAYCAPSGISLTEAFPGYFQRE